ncbi:MAG: exodeoxyribonuclease VII large subunit [Nitrospina sp.]|jgi:exodeoxyribonuclease VII large subunit|nr:exodeoxyribonuclease VII large subunit [Nitrospina sp.]MBT3509386.1 exodeoxyribonuclease VII large subunit [Nitrospina sp.]MBT3875450.1 exodeoxyribonuclease VII large subunit [Nitrospina sp.]MBT4047273.1 exodeoxyribonuclease VII large subunit [Nitrospina sp.]MBT4556274.1 exodeoxyribonuclease VII large subunit [Nitrospina sp.]
MIRKKQSRLSKPQSQTTPEKSTKVPSHLEAENAQPQVYSVSSLTRDIRAIMEAAFDSVWIEGEISNFRTVASGHSYFVLKDDKAQIRCVLFKGHRAGIKFQPEDGDQVLLFGRITVYDARGEYQIIAESMEPRGLGALQKAFEQLKEKLDKEGLFDEEIKKPLPIFPWKVGVVTSPTGAAVRDILNVIRRRNPRVSVLLCPAKVQGEGSAGEIAQSIRALNSMKDVEVIIVGRGGGSLEDLWAFNEEEVARAIFASQIPIVSAVGHEIDFTIADFVADLRAPTPSAAAELTVPVLKEIVKNIRSLTGELLEAISQNVEAYRDLLNRLMDRRFFHQPKEIFSPHIQRLDELHGRMVRNLGQGLIIHQQRLKDRNHRLIQASPKNKIQQLSEKLNGLQNRAVQNIQNQVRFRKERFEGFLKNLNAVNPLAILERGYSICSKDEKSLKSSAGVKPGDKVAIRLSKGELDCTVDKIIEEI